MQNAEKLVTGMDAIRAAVRVGVHYQRIKYGDEMPSQLQRPFSILHLVDASNDGPAAFGADALLRDAGAIYLHEQGAPFDALTVAKISLECPLVIIETGAAFRLWFMHVVGLGLARNLFARGLTNPRSAAQ
jgi:hypothetical protein